MLSIRTFFYCLIIGIMCFAHSSELHAQFSPEVLGKKGYTFANFTPDGEYVVTASGKKSAELWKSTGEKVYTFRKHMAPIKAVNFNFLPHRKLIVTMSTDNQIHFWEMVNGSVQPMENDWLGKKFKKDLRKSTYLNFSDDGNFIVLAGKDGKARVWSINEERMGVLTGHFNGLTAANFSPDGKYIATASKDNTARLWTRQGRLIKVFNGHKGDVTSVTFSPDGKQLLTASEDKTAKLWNLDGKVNRTFHGHVDPLSSASFFSDGKHIITASISKTLMLWKIDNEQEVRKFRGQKGWVTAMNYSDENLRVIRSASKKSNTTYEVAKVFAPAERQKPLVFEQVGYKEVASVDDTPMRIQTTDLRHQKPMLIPDIPPMRVWAVIVGISDYPHISPLEYADDDAYHMYAYLRSPEGGAVPEENIKLLIDQDATEATISAALRQMAGQAGKNDMLLFFFTGHAKEGELLPHDFNGVRNRISNSKVVWLLDESQAKHKLCLVDACHSGSLGMLSRGPETVSTNTNASTMSDRYYSAFANSTGGVAYMTSSTAREVSVASHAFRQGVFSHYLMEGLKGKADYDMNKVITVTELYNFIRQKVGGYTLRKQTPMLFGNHDPHMPIGVLR